MREASLKIFPNRKKTSKKDSSTPLYMRVIIGRAKAEAKLPIKLSIQELKNWNDINMCVNDPKSVVNDKIRIFHARFTQFVNRNFEQLNLISAFNIRDAILERNVDFTKKIVLNYCEAYYLNKIELSGVLTKGTKINYRKGLNKFNEYLKFKKLTLMSFTDIPCNLGNDYMTFLTSDIREIKKKHVIKSTAVGYIKKLITIFNQAVNEELIAKNPFKNVSLKIEKRKKQALDILQVKSIYQNNLANFPSLEKCRNLFLFQIFSGLSFQDMQLLNQNQIFSTSKGGFKFVINRLKTREAQQLPISKYLQQIIDTFSLEPYVQIHKTVVPKISLKEYNLKLKVIADHFKIPVLLSSHHARHTFRQLISEAEIEDMAVIYTFMGWSRERTIDVIYHNITEKRLLDAANLFEVYLDNHLGSSGVHSLQI